MKNKYLQEELKKLPQDCDFNFYIKDFNISNSVYEDYIVKREIGIYCGNDTICLIPNVYSDIHPTKLTDKKDILSLLEKLYPIEFKLIRLGSEKDGGYLVPDDLGGIDACFSPGVAGNSSFEIDCANRGMKVFLADNSVDKPSEEHSLFSFTKKHIGSINNDNFMTMDSWVKSSLLQSDISRDSFNLSDLLLQMDIDDAEYEVLLNISDELLKRFRIIIIEFHSLYEMWNKPMFKIISRVFERLLQTHTCVHNHPNCYGGITNKGVEIPTAIEMTFLRNDRLKERKFVEKFPHELDSDNSPNPYYRSIILPKCWYYNK